MIRFSNGVLRYFSLHESALLQTFPPEYVFRGKRSAAIRQIGNAAPAEIVRLLGDRIRQLLALAKVSPRARFRGPQVDLIGDTVLLQL